MAEKGKNGCEEGTTAPGARLVDEYPPQGTALVTNLSAWLRVFRPAFQRQFASPSETDIELIDLLREADRRRTERPSRPHSQQPKSAQS